VSNLDSYDAMRHDEYAQDHPESLNQISEAWAVLGKNLIRNLKPKVSYRAACLIVIPDMIRAAKSPIS